MTRSSVPFLLASLLARLSLELHVDVVVAGFVVAVCAPLPDLSSVLACRIHPGTRGPNRKGAHDGSHDEDPSTGHSRSDRAAR